ncbi:hypothetical protein ACTFIW_011831 [Dictyostelium discoideum]
MDTIENISFIISSEYLNGYSFANTEHFILSIKQNEFYCKSLSKNSDKPTKSLVKSIPFIEIQKKTFEISCICFKPLDLNTSIVIHEIDYCEPDDSFSRYSYQESFGVVNINCYPNVCLLFKTCEGLNFIKKN